MRFKKLEIQGFKSFANKTVVHFEPGVTAIVGPNGSGKSNIVDSIRWVLGEHNPRDVRAPRLEDVIFNGTDTKAPVSMAEVSLTIDNEKGLLPISFSEVTIARRVYRSGESECFINQSPCRLRDIHELFLGTGLGGGTYAIIAQGHIDMILSSKPEERRIVFEEASGVAKYLAKKNECVRRLDETEEHLVRIADITNEVRRQVNALERQANKARQYKAQWEELKSLELRLAVDELCGGDARHKLLESKAAELDAQAAGLETEKQAHVASLETCNAAVSAVQQKLQELRTKAVEFAGQIEQHDMQTSLKTRWIEELAVQSQELEREAEQIRQRLGQVDEQLARVSGGEAELREQLSATEQQLKEGEGALSAVAQAIQDALAAVNAFKTKLFEAASMASQQRNRLTELSSELQTLDARQARLEEGRAARTTRREDLRQRLESTRGEHAAQTTQLAQIQQRAGGFQTALDAAGIRRHELTGRVHQMRDQLAKERANAAVREELWRKYEGFPETVKTLMGASVEGLVGPLVDLVQASPGHEEIVEAALGPLAEAVVVRDRDALSRCREILKGQRLEGCRFLVMSDCPVALSMDSSEHHDGIAGAVKEYVQAAPEFQPLVDWILNDSWIIDDLQRLLGSGPMPGGRFVSQSGDRWDRRSWRFSGSRAIYQTRLGRRQRWEEAKANLQVLEGQLSGLESQSKDADSEWQRLLGEVESAKGALALVTPSVQRLEAQLRQLEQESARLEEEQQAAELESQDVAARSQELRAGIVDAQGAVDAAQQTQKDVEASLGESQIARETSEARRQELMIARAQVEAGRQALAERLTALAARVAELTTDRGHLQQQFDTRIQQRQDAATRTTELTQQLDQHRQAREQAAQERVRLETEAAGVEAKLREEEEKRNQVLPRLLAVEQQLAELARQLEEQRRQIAERAFRRQHLTERLRELYQIDEATIQAEVAANPPTLTEEQRAPMAEQAQKLRAKLEGIGPVSLGSVEEYDELKRRHEFLQTQQNDLIQARDDLKASITQINKAARTQFRETFEKIKVEFQHYYTRLFQGGEANLILLDEEDVLDCGIDIVARPPGKRLQSITLLSGGERALTAVALLFALFKVRPSPFCILDEIDAPLDEANVDRFTRVLEEFLVLSQFILITHNKKTITKADSLYGVTMQEAGISKVLSAKLQQSRGESAPPAPAPAPAAA